MPRVPLSSPVAVLKDAQTGLFKILNVSVPLLSRSLAEGIKLYGVFGVAVLDGVPLIVGAMFTCSRLIPDNTGVRTGDKECNSAFQRKSSLLPALGKV